MIYVGTLVGTSFENGARASEESNLAPNPSKARPDHQQASQSRSPRSERLLLFPSLNCRDAMPAQARR